MSIDVNPDEDFHVVIDGRVMAMSLEDLDSWYQKDIIEDATLIWQPGLGEWMRLDTVLAELEQGAPDIASAPPMDEDIYFVLIAEGEVKQMSLDLLADTYRLDVIDEDTLVWQPGYTEWVPLKLLIGDEPEQHVSLMPSMAPAAMPSSSSQSHGMAPVPMVSSPASSSFANAPLSSNWGMSAPPVALSVPATPPAASPWFARSLVALSCLAVVFAMYRNGVGAAAAAEMGQEKELASLEGKLQKPGRDTPHGLDSWLSEINAKYELDALSQTEPVPSEKAKNEAASQPPQTSEEEGKKGAPAEEKADQPEGAATEKTEPTAKKSGDSDPAAAFGAKLNNQPAPAKKSAAPVRSYKKPASKKLPTSGDRYDPMNGAL